MKTREGFVPVANAELYYREVGKGLPLVILHSGPDFSHSYLLPDMDPLSNSYRLIYYDQRGRGRSTAGVRPEDVSISSDVDDLEHLREYLHLDEVVLLGHSWGALLALEYAIRRPRSVSRLVLMNSAPASHEDYILLQRVRKKRSAADVEELKARSSDPMFQEADPETVAEHYRVHFRATLRQQAHLDEVIARLRRSFNKEGILKARAIEQQLMNETFLSNEYNLIPKLRLLAIPTLVIHGDHDIVPVECAAHIAQAIPDAQLVLLRGCGHFSYLERPDEVHRKVTGFLDCC